MKYGSFVLHNCAEITLSYYYVLRRFSKIRFSFIRFFIRIVKFDLNFRFLKRIYMQNNIW